VSRSYLYSDSVADTPLLEEVGHPVVVNPKPVFRAEALRRGWEVVEWKGRWKTEGKEDALSEEWLSWEG
jgi:phosphoserine phosphatase